MGNAIAAQTADTPDGQNGVKHAAGQSATPLIFKTTPRRRDKDCGAAL